MDVASLRCGWEYIRECRDDDLEVYATLDMPLQMYLGVSSGVDVDLEARQAQDIEL